VKKALASILVLFASHSALAENELIVRGFLNTIWGKSAYPEIITWDKVANEGDMVALSTYGLVLTKNINEHWSAAMMTLARGIENDDFQLAFEWANLTYRPNSEVTFRVGKQKFPFYLHSDNSQVGALYPWIRPPAEVYSMIPYESYHGVSFDYLFQDVFGGDLTLELFNAQIDGFVYGTTPYRINAKGEGALFQFKKSELNFRGSYFKAGVQKFVLADILPITMSRLDSWSLGASFDSDRHLFIYEKASLGSDAEFFIRKIGDYLTLGHYFQNHSILFHATGSQTLVHDAGGFLGTVPIDDGKQKSFKPGLNYYFDPEVVLKLEWERTWINKGTDTLTTSDPSVTGVPHGMVDTTSIALSAVF
jgi:hypothetical protein